MRSNRSAALTMAGVPAAASLTACGGGSTGSTTAAGTTESAAAVDSATDTTAAQADADTESAAGDVVTIQVGYENVISEPAAKTAEEWKELVEFKSNGIIKMEFFPDFALGKKTELIDQMILGEPMITVADGAFLADYGVPDSGIFYAPFTFDTWGEERSAIDGDWHRGLCDELAQKASIRVLSSNWVYGTRNILSVKPVTLPEDLAGLKLRVSSNDLSISSFNSLGASSVSTDMDDAYQALQVKTVDAVENPVTPLANRSFQEVAEYLVEDEHILTTSMWIRGNTLFQSLTADQQKTLTEAADEVGLYNNELQEAAEEDAGQKLLDAGVTIITLTGGQKAGWIEAGQSFYDIAGEILGWSDGLYDTVEEAVK